MSACAVRRDAQIRLDIGWRTEKGFMSRPILNFLAFVPIVVAGCSQNDPASKPSAPVPKAQTNTPATVTSVPVASQPVSKGNDYVPPTAEEMAPMRAEYLAELSKIHEPPEIGRKAMLA